MRSVHPIYKVPRLIMFSNQLCLLNFPMGLTRIIRLKENLQRKENRNRKKNFNIVTRLNYPSE